MRDLDTKHSMSELHELEFNSTSFINLADKLRERERETLLTKSIKTRHNIPLRRTKRILVEPVIRETVHGGQLNRISRGRYSPIRDFQIPYI